MPRAIPLPLMDMILDKIPGPEIDAEAPLQMLVTTLDWSDYVGRIAIGRLYSGEVKPGMDVALMQRDDKIVPARIVSVHVFEDLGRTEVQSAQAGDIVALVGLENIEIGDTVTDRNSPRALPRLVVDEPTLKMTFGVNTSPLAGQEGRYLTSRHLRERLMKELQKNVALRVEPIPGTEQFSVSGRGILHLSVLIETMRREGFELSIGKPHVILHDNHGVTEEPFESLVVEVPENQTGPVMEMTGQRRGAVGRHAGAQQLLVHGFFDSCPRADRAADAASERHPGNGRDPPSFRVLQTAGRRDRNPVYRRAGFACRRPGRGLCPRHAPGPVRAARRP